MLFGHAAVETSFHLLNCVVYCTVTVFTIYYLSVLGMASVHLSWWWTPFHVADTQEPGKNDKDEQCNVFKKLRKYKYKRHFAFIQFS